ncbi:hypothetical protein [Alkalihalobacterium elongatum]|uniref:hypothetical protein n=1 Tax=Alkalihalobacterium elongatum TaxID=2675466 RepID=UPI001C1F9007|nr:hypothetical protein [Alkalihalobacterium elongatum]
MESSRYGVHEIVDLRELSNFKWACLTQAKTRLELVENPELKQLVEQSIQQGTMTVGKMKDFLSDAQTQMNQ